MADSPDTTLLPEIRLSTLFADPYLRAVFRAIERGDGYPCPRRERPASKPKSPLAGSAASPRAIVEDVIQRLIESVDTMDEDPDLEENGDAEPDQDGEPSLGSNDFAEPARVGCRQLRRL